MPMRALMRNIPAQRRASLDSGVGVNSDTVAHINTKCSNCNLRELCQPCCGLTGTDKDIANHPLFKRSRVRRGECLYRTGDPFMSLYAVRNGCFKSIVLHEDGRRDQVTGFSIEGEVMGMDGIATERHACNAIALEDSIVCAIPYALLQEVAHRIPKLQRHIHRTMSREIVREHGVMLLLGSMNANERVATFLLNLSQRCTAHGGSPSNLDLHMTREEIGSFLGLTLETVSRILSKFQEEGLLSVQKKMICSMDLARLRQVMGRESS